jgi:PAS domain S-box-containing protein
LSQSQPDYYLFKGGNLEVLMVTMRSEEKLSRNAAELAKNEKRLKELLKERSMFLNLMNNLPLSVYFKDKEGRLIKVSKIYEDTHPGGVIGKTDFDLYPEEEAREATEEDRRVMETGQPIVNREGRTINSDGNEHYWLTTKAPVFDDEGNIMGIAGITTEITERKKAEKERLEAEKEVASKRVAAEAVAKIAVTTSEMAQRYKATIDELRLAQEKLTKDSNLLQSFLGTTPAFIYFKDREGRYLRVSKSCQMTQPESMTGKTDFDLYSEDEATKAAEDDKRVMETGQPIIDKEERFTAPDGKELYLLTTTAPLFDKEGNVAGIVGIARDITQQKKGENIKGRIKTAEGEYG